MGHTAGLGKGFLIFFGIILGIIAFMGGVAFIIGALLKSTFLMVLLAGLFTGAVTRWMKQSAGDSAIIGGCGAASAFLASLVFRSLGGFTGGLVGLFVFAVAFVVLIFTVFTALKERSLKRRHAREREQHERERQQQQPK